MPISKRKKNTGLEHHLDIRIQRLILDTLRTESTL
ncbi:MAG: hypothetical protein ACI935_001296 [Moritella dasanensis]|jgi:hypothetical protein